ncbi:MAG TPA: hypothetical protein VGV59_10575 [Pyrinomonadaceae bacterium]|nr:hypothetical protein [Pyrinomonadaceae bacterium]
MGIGRKLLLVASALLLLSVAWLWWTQPQRVDMAAYVPADTLVYLEANDLPGIARAVVSTEGWKELAPAAGIEGGFGQVGWLGRLSAWTGIGSSDGVVLMRAQVAVALLGFDASVEADASARISPRIALVAETHTSEGRARTAVRKLVGDAARRRYGEVRVEERPIDGVPYVSWVAQSDTRRRLVAAVRGSVAVVARDEATVQACLAAQSGARPTLAADARLKEMRNRLGAETALVFGYAPQGSAAKILEVVAPLFVGQVSENPNTQSSLAILLPQLANSLVGSAGWSTRIVRGAVEDNYHFDLPGDLAARLNEPLTPALPRVNPAEMLPSDTQQVSLYSYRVPEQAWRGLNAAISTQLDTFKAVLVTRALESLLQPYGVESPQEFLHVAGSGLATARLSSTSEKKLLIVEARDREGLKRQVTKRLGDDARVESVGDGELHVAADAEAGAAAFVGDFLVLGDESDVRLCVAARAEGRTLAGAPDFKLSRFETPADTLPQVTTWTDDAESARAFVLFFARQRSAHPNPEALEKASRRLPRSISETRLTSAGFQKRTRSSFGQFGWIIEQFAPSNDN